MSEQPREAASRTAGRRHRPGRPADGFDPGCRAAGRRASPSITELVEQPAKVMRIGSMIRQLLEEVQLRAAGRGQPQPAQGDPPGLDQGARGRAGPGAGRGARAALAAVHRGRDAVGRRAADRPGPAGRLAGGPVPRHPDRDLRPADGRPRAVRADAPRAPAGCGRPGAAGRPGAGSARRWRHRRDVPLGRVARLRRSRPRAPGRAARRSPARGRGRPAARAGRRHRRPS